ncbi:DUF6916 family protein [Rhodopirellula sp. MGV]|uniref:DUF6916 family protein n=1 Tax=Rhodopirellula sp. MGV TaxID=2023130 RepID=UPI000B9706F0|nr:hypothetical protein [Rhodopirellula sp. MGV]OYP36008.1 hypothetical protein CGZ80_09640 [Rhodopirellula sp. MGV]PNY36634.1 hypothetical protein C2E31_12365 [Rhodopirellula baltica]
MNDTTDFAALQSLTAEFVSEFAGETFVFSTDDQSVEAQLVEIRESSQPALSPSVRKGFSILFQFPPGSLVTQRTYRLTHPELGQLHLFVVPVSPSESGPSVEVVFS